jgi:hypothetical protein
VVEVTVTVRKEGLMLLYGYNRTSEGTTVPLTFVSEEAAAASTIVTLKEMGELSKVINKSPEPDGLMLHRAIAAEELQGCVLQEGSVAVY